MSRTLEVAALQAQVAAVIEAAGSTPAEAQAVAANLVLANLERARLARRGHAAALCGGLCRRAGCSPMRARQSRWTPAACSRSTAPERVHGRSSASRRWSSALHGPRHWAAAS